MFGRRSQDDCLIGRLCKDEGYGQGVLRNAYGQPPRVLGGHSNTLDSRLGDVHPQNPYRFSLSLLRTGRVNARRLTAPSRAVWPSEDFSNLRQLCAYGEMFNTEHYDE